MKHGSEILSIIEAGIEGNKEKAFAYAELLLHKLDDSDSLKKAIKRRLTGEYKNDPILKGIKCKGCGKEANDDYPWCQECWNYRCNEMTD